MNHRDTREYCCKQDKIDTEYKCIHETIPIENDSFQLMENCGELILVACKVLRVKGAVSYTTSISEKDSIDSLIIGVTNVIDSSNNVIVKLGAHYNDDIIEICEINRCRVVGEHTDMDTYK